jgi:putative acetyltransferase
VVSIEVARTATDDVRDLIGELDRELAGEYLPEQQHGLPLQAIFQPHIRFFVARLDGVAVGCGGVALLETYGEVKRMYVRPAARGRGVGRALLSTIEATMNEHHLALLRLETGDVLLDAIRLYERAGFRRCEAFGEYAAMTPRAIESSVFYEKRLG